MIFLFDKENEIKEDFRYLFVYVRDWLQKALQCYFSEKFISLKDFFEKNLYSDAYCKFFMKNKKIVSKTWVFFQIDPFPFLLRFSILEWFFPLCTKIGKISKIFYHEFFSFLHDHWSCQYLSHVSLSYTKYNLEEKLFLSLF